MRRQQSARAGAVVVATWLACAGFAGAQPSPSKVGAEVQAADAELMQLDQVHLRAAAPRSPRYVEERLADGDLYMHLHDYVRASIVYTDIVEHFPEHRAYPDAVVSLGDALLKARDYLGARKRYREVLDHAQDPRFRGYVTRALSGLVEIASRTRDFSSIEGYFAELDALPDPELRSTIAYYRGKYLFRQAVPLDDLPKSESVPGDVTPAFHFDAALLERAAASFEAVPASTRYYPQARYFLGVVASIRGDYPQALASFEAVVALPADTDEHAVVRDRARLSVARLSYQLDRLPQAIAAYRAIPPDSDDYGDALYELAWADLRLGKAADAERALELLAVARPQSPHIPDAKVLHGNLLLKDGRYKNASEQFDAVRAEFAPIRDDLQRIRDDNPSLRAHFAELVSANLQHFDPDDFLPAPARRWSTPDNQFDRAVGAVSDLEETRRLIGETQDLIDRLDGGLGEPNFPVIFPDLRHQLQGIAAIRTRLSLARGDLVDRFESGREVGGELAMIRQHRRQLGAEIAEMPTTLKAFDERNAAVLTRMDALDRTISSLAVEIQGLDARIVATETFLRSAAQPPRGVDAINAELAAQKQAVKGFRARREALVRQLERARLTVGPGDPPGKEAEAARARYDALVAQERAAAGADADARYAALFQQIDALDARAAAREQTVWQVANERVGAMRVVVDEERSNLDRYRATLGGLKDETEDVVGAIAYAHFLAVSQRFYQLVLEADVGEVDVAWARREEHRMRVDELTRARAREVQALDDEFKEIEGTPARTETEEAQP